MVKRKFCFIGVLIIATTLIMGCDIETRFNRTNNDSDEITANSDEEFEKIFNEEIEIENIEKIKIDIECAKVKVYTVKGNKVIVDRKCSDIFGDINVTTMDKAIKIIEDDINLNNINFNKLKNNINIGIPESYEGDIDFDYGVGACEISDINADEFDIGCGTGKLTVDGVSFNELDMSVGVGECNISLDKSGDMNIEGGVGSINISIEEVGGDLYYEGGVGNTEIYIPDNSPVFFKTETGIGHCSVDVKTSGENTYKFDLQTGMGSIEVSEI